jgi:predicted extracellular nuclease
VNGIQNGAPDGIALVDNTNNLVQFLSYEGSFVGVGGAADGITSTDVGVSEIGNESTGLSLQLTGTGTTYQDFTWASPATETPDAVNNGQTFGAAPPDTTPPTIASTDPADSATNVALDSNITVNFNEPVSIAAGAISVDCPSYGVPEVSSIPASSVNDYTFDPSIDFALGETCTVTVDAALIIDTATNPFDGDGNGSSGDDAIFSFTTITSLVPNVVITEIMYDPNSPEDDWEWVEIYNQSGSAIDFSATPWVIDDINGSSHGSANITSGTIGAGSAAVLYNADDILSADFEAAWGTGINLIPVTNWGAMGLNNGGDTVSLWDSFASYSGDHTIHANAQFSVNYGSAGFPDPVGTTIYLTDLSADATQGANWATSSVSGGTPLGTGYASVNTNGNVGGEIASPQGSLPLITVFIHEVQGNASTQTAGGAHDDVSPLNGNTVTIEAIVVGDYQPANELEGFFVQEEDADVDADASTSEGLFVYCDTCPTDVNVGDLVEVTGSVSEFSGQTQISATGAGDITIVSTGNALPSVASVALPVVGDRDDYFEQFEGMLVQFNQSLVVTEFFELGRYGQLVLATDRQRQFVQDNQPDAAGYTAHQTNILNNRIILDDRESSQNDDPVFHPQPGGFSWTNFIRGGATVTNPTAIMSFGFSEWRLRPTANAPISFTNPPRPTAPPSVGAANITVSSFNVLNYFTTFDVRGAHSVQELNRQTERLVNAMEVIDADVFGLMEIENNGDTAVSNLVAALNAQVGAGTYDFVSTGVVGGDQIVQAIIYKSGVLTPVGAPATLTASAFVDPTGSGSDRNRPAIAQTFQVTDATNPDDGATFTVVVLHLKSKGGSGCSGTDCDQGDGQGNWAQTRALATDYLVNTWLPTDPTDTATNLGTVDTDYLVIGDYNGYFFSDALDNMRAAGYSVLNTQADYSFVFDGEWGALDHAVASSTMATQVTGTVEWHINADENNLLDYNDTIQDPGEAFFEAKPSSNALYDAGNPLFYRASDHDPLIIGLDLTAPAFSSSPAATTTLTGTTPEGTPVDLNVTFSNVGDADLSVDLAIAPYITGANASVFSLDATAFPLTLAPSGTFDLAITCDGTTAGTYTATLNLTTNDPNNATVAFDLSCTVNAPGTGGTGSTGGTTVVGVNSFIDALEASIADALGLPDDAVFIIITPNAVFGGAGDSLTWTVIIRNPSNTLLTNLRAFFSFSDGLRVLSGNTSAGNLSINAQASLFNSTRFQSALPRLQQAGADATLSLAQLAPSESVTVTFNTAIDDNFVGTVVSLTTTLRADGFASLQSATSRVLLVTQLPATGETPADMVPIRNTLLSLGTLGLLLGALGAGWWFRRQRA